MHYPELTHRLVVLNLPHPNGLRRELAENPKQQAASEYARWFQQPDSAAQLTAVGPAACVRDPAASQRYVEAFERSSFDAMINYDKANYPHEPYEDRGELPPVTCPVL
jgi:pimeloyl-ACP methyl ester carboxylesterase